MNTHAVNTREKKNHPVANRTSQKLIGGERGHPIADIRPAALNQQEMQRKANNSPQVAQLRALQDLAISNHQVDTSGNRVAKERESNVRAQPALQMMSKEKQGSAGYKKLEQEKAAYDKEIAALQGLTLDALIKEELDRLDQMQKAEYANYGSAKSYTPFYKDQSQSTGKRVAWRMCEDIRMGKEPGHVAETKAEMKAYTEDRAKQRLAEGRKKLFKLNEQSRTTAQL